MNMLAPTGAIFLIATYVVATRPSTRTRYPGTVALILIYAYAVLRDYPPDIRRNFIYQNALHIGIMFLMATDLAVLNAHAIHKYRGQTRPDAQMNFIQRLRWSADQILCSRGVNWSWEVPNLRRSRLSRWAFVGSRLSQVLVCVLLSDIIAMLCQQNPAYQVHSSEGFGSRGFIRQTYNVSLFWGSVAANQLFGYNLLSAIMVGLGVYEPKDWPSLYGHWSNAKSVRKFWGQTWHQLLRRPLQSYGRCIANEKIGSIPGTRASSYIQLYIAFLVSAILHSVADWPTTRSIAVSRGTFIFYMLQAIIITAEDGLIGFGRSLGVQKIPSALCYVWVIIWMGWSGPIWIEGLAKEGVNLQLSFSLIGRWLS